MEQVYTPKQNYKVLVNCMTYNQSMYIEDALNGFAMQKTDFPFVCLVMDDASTDGEQEVIKAWMERECDMGKAENVEIEKSFVTIVPHKTNSSCTFAFYFLKENLYGTGKKTPMIALWREYCEYEAICEGDDYWIHPEKLQKQVNFLDKDINVSMVFHSAKILLELRMIPELKCFNIENREYTATELLKDWIVPTASIVYRINSLDYPIKNENKILNGDIFLVEKCAHTGKVLGLSDFMSVYRVQNSGVTYDSHLNRERAMKYPEHFECIAENFPKIDKHVINVRLLESYWARATFQESFILKIADYHNGMKCVGWKYRIRPIFLLILKKIKSFLS